MKRLLGVVALMLLFLVGIVFGINLYLTPDDLKKCSLPSKDKNDTCRRADAIVAVSGGDTTSRAKKAIELYKAGWADKIIFSGDTADPAAISNAEAMKRIAVDNGVPKDTILLDTKSKDTRQNAINVAQILKQQKIDDVILVSSSYHLRRVQANFAKASAGVTYRTAAAADSRWDYWYLKPSGWWLALSELGGIVELYARSLL